MNKQDKELFLKYLCCSLPYGVKVKIKYYDDVWKLFAIYTNGMAYATRDIEYTIETYFEDIKPYLFPLSSMTEEQKKEFIEYSSYEISEEDCGRHKETYYYDMVGHEDKLYPNYKAVDWLNKNHFDYRGLIEKGLALDATGLNIYN